MMERLVVDSLTQRGKQKVEYELALVLVSGAKLMEKGREEWENQKQDEH